MIALLKLLDAVVIALVVILIAALVGWLANLLDTSGTIVALVALALVVLFVERDRFTR